MSSILLGSVRRRTISTMRQKSMSVTANKCKLYFHGMVLHLMLLMYAADIIKYNYEQQRRKCIRLGHKSL